MLGAVSPVFFITESLSLTSFSFSPLSFTACIRLSDTSILVSIASLSSFGTFNLSKASIVPMIFFRGSSAESERKKGFWESVWQGKPEVNIVGIPTEKEFEDYINATQQLQADALKTAIEAHMKAQPRCMGTLIWQLNDCWPGASWSLIDYYGNKRQAFFEVPNFDEMQRSAIRERSEEHTSELQSH